VDAAGRFVKHLALAVGLEGLAVDLRFHLAVEDVDEYRAGVTVRRAGTPGAALELQHGHLHFLVVELAGQHLLHEGLLLQPAVPVAGGVLCQGVAARP
jgi:hypothetical protein